MHEQKIVQDNGMHKILRWKKITQSRPEEQTKWYLTKKKKKKRNCRIVDFAFLVDHWVKIKDIEKKENTLTLPENKKKKKAMTQGTVGDTNYG